MNCNSARDVFPSLLDSRTTASEHAEARAHLAHCPDCQREFAALSQTVDALDAMSFAQPSSRLRKNFYAMLEEEKHSAASVHAASARASQARRTTWWRWIVLPSFGCALLLFGFLAGARLGGPATVAPAGADATQRELTALRTQMARQQEQLAQQNVQLGKMTTLVAYQLVQQQKGPANDRLEDVLAAAKNEAPSDKALDDLVSALAFDPSANVRLRALEALYPHAERAVVRAGVLAALPREQNPLVQLELIDFVAAARNGDAAPVLETLSQNQMIDLSVREAAKRALAQLTLSTTNNAASTTSESKALN